MIKKERKTTIKTRTRLLCLITIIMVFIEIVDMNVYYGTKDEFRRDFEIFNAN